MSAADDQDSPGKEETPKPARAKAASTGKAAASSSHKSAGKAAGKAGGKAAAGKAPARAPRKPGGAASKQAATPGSITHWDGTRAASVTLDGAALGDETKPRLLRAVARMYEANRRQGTVSTKTRGETAYTTRKPYRQKGTGNARRGDFNSPLLRGGGVIFGPRPRDFGYSVPRKALREALRSALAGKLRDGEVCSLTGESFTAPSTKAAAAALAGLACEGSVVVVLPGDRPVIWKSFRNIPRVSVVRASDLNAYHVLAHDRMVLVDDAWEVLRRRLPATRGEPAEAAS